MDEVQPGHANKAPRPPESSGEALVRIDEQGRQTLELVRALVNLLTPKEGDRDGPTLEDLLSTLIMQARETIAIVKAIQQDLGLLLDATPVAAGEGTATHAGRKQVSRT